MTYFVDVYGTVIDETTEMAYPDGRSFLQEKENNAILISADSVDAPIKAALAGIPRLTILLTNDMPKGEFLAMYPHLVPSEALFVDDSPRHLASVAEHFPHVKLFEMRRDGTKGDGRWPVVRSLSELP